MKSFEVLAEEPVIVGGFDVAAAEAFAVSVAPNVSHLKDRYYPKLENLGIHIDVDYPGLDVDSMLTQRKVLFSLEEDHDAAVSPHILKWHFDYTDIEGMPPARFVFGATKRMPELLHGRLELPIHFQRCGETLRDALLRDEGQEMIDAARIAGDLEPFASEPGDLVVIGHYGLHRRVPSPVGERFGTPRVNIKRWLDT